jgi:hypothetical protein
VRKRKQNKEKQKQRKKKKEWLFLSIALASLQKSADHRCESVSDFFLSHSSV